MDSASKAKNEARLTSPLLRCCVLFGRVANSHYFSIEPATRCNTLQQSQRTARAIAGMDDFRFSTRPVTRTGTLGSRGYFTDRSGTPHG